MEEIRGTLVPILLDYLKMPSSLETPSSDHIVLRVVKTFPLTLTDGFYSIETDGIHDLETNYFIKTNAWTVHSTLHNIKLVVLDYTVLGKETMSDQHIKPIKLHSGIKALFTSLFRYQLQTQLPECTEDYIKSLVNIVS